MVLDRVVRFLLARRRPALMAAGFFFACGMAGAAWELFLDSFFNITEPLAGFAYFWSFFHRAKFYGFLAALWGGITAGVWIGVAALAQLLRRRWRPAPWRRAALAGGLAAMFAGTPIWYGLAVWGIQLRASDGLRVLGVWLIGFILFLIHFLRFGRLSRRLNAVVRYAFAVVGFIGFGVYAGAAVWSVVTRPAAIRGAPDVILITIDAWRADAFGGPPGGPTLTPNLDGFARSAVVFRQCRAQASWTSPSLGTLHTGQYPMVHLTTADRPLGTSQPTLAEVLRAAGYDTKAIVANRLLGRASGLARGFAYYHYWDHNRFLEWLGYYETYYYYLEESLYRQRNTKPGEQEKHTRVITDRLVNILKAPRRRPLFLWAHYLDPHTPYHPPAAFVRPADRRFLGKVIHGDKRYADVLRRFYDGEVRYVDAELGRVLPLIKPNALVIITSDHGEEFWEHDGYDHGRTLYDEVLRVPLIVRWPGGPVGVTDAPVGLVDIAPTVVASVGLAVPATMQGRDISAAASGASWDYPIFAGASMLKGDRQYCVVYRNAKLIVKHNQSMAEGAFYNLAADPGERNKITTYREDRAQLEDMLRAWVKKNLEEVEKFQAGEVSPAAYNRLRAMGYVQ